MATSTESASGLPHAAEAANIKTLTKAMADTKVSDKTEDAEPKKEETASASASASTNGDDKEKVEEGDSLEDGEIREEEEVDDGKPKTVFDSKKKYNLKHPLSTKWTLYFDSPQSKALPKTPSSTPATPQIAHGGWMDDIRKVVAVDSVEEFWGMYNNIVPPSQLPGKANYYFFRDNIMPAWEDEANKKGGKWSIQLPRDKFKANIDQMWLYTMLAAIGETFEIVGDSPHKESNGLVTGVIISPRPAFYRVNIWTRSAPDLSQPDTEPLKAKILALGRMFKDEILGFNETNKLVAGSLQSEVTFESHKDSEKKGNKNKVIV